MEGPAYSPVWRCLLVSDIPNDRILRWDEVTGEVSVWRSPAAFANGRILDRAGRIVSCEQGSRSVTRIEPDGRVTAMADSWDGRRLNSPNDVVEHSDGSLWFTDPDYGVASDYEGHRAEREQEGCHVYRVDPGGTVQRVADDFDKPNGLAFAADERQLYVVDTGRAHVRRFDVGPAGRLRGGEVLATCDAGSFGGLRVDELGRLWVAAHDGLHCFDPDGTLLGKLRLPEVCSNLTFGGTQGNVLFVTASNALLSIRLNVRAAR
ncbi:MAG: SMP-30/gluconolactonase/LRE family protein [Tetrasphaera sp.]